jgi:hypothetical protein
MQALRQFLLHFSPALEEAWKYRMPVYMYKGRMLCYLWTRKAGGQPYLGIVKGSELEHPELVQEERKRMKIFLVNPDADLPVSVIKELLTMAMTLY